MVVMAVVMALAVSRANWLWCGGMCSLWQGLGWHDEGATGLETGQSGRWR